MFWPLDSCPITPVVKERGGITSNLGYSILKRVARESPAYFVSYYEGYYTKSFIDLCIRHINLIKVHQLVQQCKIDINEWWESYRHVYVLHSFKRVHRYNECIITTFMFDYIESKIKDEGGDTYWIDHVACHTLYYYKSHREYHSSLRKHIFNLYMDTNDERYRRLFMDSFDHMVGCYIKYDSSLEEFIWMAKVMRLPSLKLNPFPFTKLHGRVAIVIHNCYYRDRCLYKVSGRARKRMIWCAIDLRNLFILLCHISLPVDILRSIKYFL